MYEIKAQSFHAGDIVAFGQSDGADIEWRILAVDGKEALITSADPRNILSRGYVLVTDDRGKVMKTAGRAYVGERIGVRFSDGALRATVSDVWREDADGAQSAATA